VEAGALTPAIPGRTDAVLAGCRDGSLRLLYMAPERLRILADRRLAAPRWHYLIAVDEAALPVSQWGHDFPARYLRHRRATRSLKRPLAAFPRTAARNPRRNRRKAIRGKPRSFLRGF